MIKHNQINHDNTTFVIISFEGPDRYSMAGGLGVRVAELSDTLASLGYDTNLIFVGDPNEPGLEIRKEGKLRIHRWCQWISAYHPQGVYANEEGKLSDFNDSLPPFVVNEIVKPAVSSGRMVAILGEEWHTAEAMCRISDILYYNGLRQNVLMAWNANNIFAFDKINWGRLNYTTTLMTVSRYMKHIMWGRSVNPLVVPNGIPSRLLDEVDMESVLKLINILNSELFLFKVGRFDPDKRWIMAIDAVALLKNMGTKVKMVMRGGIEPHEGEILSNAYAKGLKVVDVKSSGRSLDDAILAIQQADSSADIYNLKFFVPEEFLRVAYRAADAVLANSGHEPFGLVGLEVMAAKGLAFTGSTGEDYAIPFTNSMVVETDDPFEIVSYLNYIMNNPTHSEQIRNEGKNTAQRFTWEKVIPNLISKFEYIARNQNLLSI